MASAPAKPTRREERRAQTVREIKNLAMKQVAQDGPNAVSLSGIVREMSMSPAALYRYFENRDALLADLVVDSYDDLAGSLAALEQGRDTAEHYLDTVLRGSREWAIRHPNAYRLIFQTSLGSGESFASDRTIQAASRSMAVLIAAIDAVATRNGATKGPGPTRLSTDMVEALHKWRDRSDLSGYAVDVLALGLLSWTRLHGIISLELGGHLAATGIGAALLFDAEVRAIGELAKALPAHHRDRRSGTLHTRDETAGIDSE